MKVLAINGSARKAGNTAILLRHVMDELEKEGIETELVELAGKTIHGCKACYVCSKNQDNQCSHKKDDLNAVLDKMVEADGFLIGSPTYFADVTAEIKALIDRSGMVARANGNLFSRRVAAPVVAVRRAGSIHAIDTINHYLSITGMIIPGSTYWNMGMGRDKGEVESDQEGLQTMANLGRNMAWLMKKIAA
jgi:multimeric flavodoxin WrbA